jgi:hypothetical protein
MKFLASPLLLAAARLFASFIVFGAGAFLISLGAYLIHPAAGLIVGGLVLALCAIAYETRGYTAPGADDR